MNLQQVAVPAGTLAFGPFGELKENESHHVAGDGFRARKGNLLRHVRYGDLSDEEDERAGDVTEDRIQEIMSAGDVRMQLIGNVDATKMGVKIASPSLQKSVVIPTQDVFKFADNYMQGDKVIRVSPFTVLGGSVKVHCPELNTFRLDYSQLIDLMRRQYGSFKYGYTKISLTSDNENDVFDPIGLEMNGIVGIRYRFMSNKLSNPEVELPIFVEAEDIDTGAALMIDRFTAVFSPRNGAYGQLIQFFGNKVMNGVFMPHIAGLSATQNLRVTCNPGDNGSLECYPITPFELYGEELFKVFAKV